MTLEVRAPAPDDVPALTELVNRVFTEVGEPPEESEQSMQLWLTAPDLNPQADSRVATNEASGGLRGYADVSAHPEPRYWADLRVPISESDDVRTALIGWIEERARERAAGQQHALLRFYVLSADVPVKQLLEGADYRLIRHSYRMRIDFDDDPPLPEWPEGISVRSAADADTRAIYEAHQEAFEDSWEHSREPFDEWTHWMLGYEGFDPTLWFLAEEDGEVAGVSLCRVHEVDRDIGWVRELGVRRRWRRRGLGRALLLHSFHELKRRGVSAVCLGVDAQSLTGANRLYERAGMRIIRQSDIYEKAL